MIREILTDSSPVLREISREVSLEELPGDRVQQVIDDLVATFKSRPAAGLAAPQIGELLRIVVLGEPLAVLVNPVVTPATTARDTDFEGCLSVPGLRGQVERYRSVRVQALTRDGRPIDTHFAMFRARVVQHEVDHLDGILYTERSGRLEPVDASPLPPPRPDQEHPIEERRSGSRTTLVIDSTEPATGEHFVSFTFAQKGRLVALRLEPRSAVVTSVYLSGLRLRPQGFRAGAASAVLVGSGLDVLAGDTLRIHLRLSKKQRIVAEADVDA